METIWKNLDQREHEVEVLAFEGKSSEMGQEKNENSEGKDGGVMNTFHLQMEMITQSRL